MRLYWKKEDTTTWRLLCEPAAILMTLKRHVGRWEASCLNAVGNFPDALTIEGAKVVALDWFEETIQRVGPAIAELRQREAGTVPTLEV